MVAASDEDDLKDAGDRVEAQKILMEICHVDLRCRDAHAHLGNLVFDRRPQEAIRHHAVGLRIAELSLGDGFEGMRPWGDIDNRPFLRCMPGCHSRACENLVREDASDRTNTAPSEGACPVA